MIHYIADESTPLDFLARVYEEVVLYDSTGTQVIGHFIPVASRIERGKQIYAEMDARIDPKEMERRAADPGPHRLNIELIKELEELYPIDAPSSPGVAPSFNLPNQEFTTESQRTPR